MKVKFNSTVPFRHSAEGRLISLIDANGFTTGYTYDANGNLTTKKNKTTAETTTYTWDYEGRLIKAVMPNGLTNTYKYDPFGRRVEKSVNGTITRYVYDNEDILFEYNNAGALAAKYTHDPGVDEPLSVDMLGKLYYYNADALGSVTG
ncbi:MAG: RHS repeat protein, partial [Nitrospirae bacterium]|nr:RHS repeat protein [Nitrospirota bacterium]